MTTRCASSKKSSGSTLPSTVSLRHAFLGVATAELPSSASTDKKESTAEILKEHPFDIFFDNVGGETLDLALENIRPFGRIIACVSRFRCFLYRMVADSLLHADQGAVSRESRSSTLAEALPDRSPLPLEYNLLPEERYGVKNTFLVVGKQLTYRGFIISGKDLGNFFEEMPRWVASGEIK